MNINQHEDTIDFTKWLASLISTIIHVCSAVFICVSLYLQALQKLYTSDITPKSLRDMSDNVLLLVTTTIEHMEEVREEGGAGSGLREHEWWGLGECMQWERGVGDGRR